MFYLGFHFVDISRFLYPNLKMNALVRLGPKHAFFDFYSWAWVLGPTEIGTGRLRRVDRNSGCEDMRLLGGSEELDKGRRQQPAGFRNHSRKVQNPNPACILVSMPFWIDFRSTLDAKMLPSKVILRAGSHQDHVKNQPASY